MSPLAWKTKRNHQTGQNLRKGDLEITKRMPKENFLKFFNQRQAKKAALRVKREPRRKMNPVKGVKELSGSGLNWKRISNIVFYPEQNSCLQKSQHFTVYTVICFCFFQKHLLNTYKEPKKKKKKVYFKSGYSTPNESRAATWTNTIPKFSLQEAGRHLVSLLWIIQAGSRIKKIQEQ